MENIYYYNCSKVLSLTPECSGINAGTGNEPGGQRSTGNVLQCAFV